MFHTYILYSILDKCIDSFFDRVDRSVVGIDILKVGDVVKWAEITDVTGDKWWVENAAVTIVNNKIIMFSVRGGGNIYTLDNDTERYEDTYVCEISYERCQDEITWSK